jgi:putative solute:sodium symporter small subunit
MSRHTLKAYRKSSLSIVLSLLIVWFVSSFLSSILIRDWLDANFPAIGNAPFGFWMSQQGSIIVFILLLIAYRILMNRLDAKHGLVDKA